MSSWLIEEPLRFARLLFLIFYDIHIYEGLPIPFMLSTLKDILILNICCGLHIL